MNYLEVDSVRLNFGERALLHGAYVRINEGEIVGLLGRNGTGKSTLLAVMYGIQAAQDACVRLNGTYIPKLYQLHGQVGYLPQQSFIPPFLRVRQAFALYQTDVSAVRAYFPGIDEWLPYRFGELPPGRRRLLETLTITGSPASFLLLDEPFHSLSQLEVETLANWLVASKQNKGLLITDHAYRTVLDLSDRVYLLTGQGQTKRLQEPLAQLRQLGYLP